jgi:hypothetical protein
MFLLLGATDRGIEFLERAWGADPDANWDGACLLVDEASLVGVVDYLLDQGMKLQRS